MTSQKIKLGKFVNLIKGMLPKGFSNIRADGNDIKLNFRIQVGIPNINIIDREIPLRLSFARFYEHRIYMRIKAEIAEPLINKIVNNNMEKITQTINLPNNLNYVGFWGNEIKIDLNEMVPGNRITNVRFIGGNIELSDNTDDPTNHLEYWAGGNAIFTYDTLEEAVNAYRSSEDMWSGNEYRVYNNRELIKKITVGEIRAGSTNGTQGYPDSFRRIFKEYLK